MVEVQSSLRKPLILGDKRPADVTNDICEIIERKPTGLWWAAIAVSGTMLLVGASCRCVIRSRLGSAPGD